MSTRTLIQPDIDFVRNVKSGGGDTLKNCFQCATCSVVCSLSPQDAAFPRKEVLWAGWGQSDKLVADPDVWLCHNCSDCSTHCPRGAKPAEVLDAVRAYVIRFFAIPKFMGSLAQNPKNIFPLLFFPILIILAVLYLANGGDISHLSEGEIVFAKLFPHGVLDPFFIVTSVIIYSLAGLSLFRFYKNLNVGNGPPSDKSFLSLLIATAAEIFTHKKFDACNTNSQRFWGHLFVFYGFIGAFITTAAAAIADLGFGYEAPIPFFSPIKLLGNISGIAIVIGSIIILIQRLGTKKDDTANTYNDWLLITFIFGVALTGLFSQSFRLLEIPELAYGFYFVHLVFIAYVIWYAPYSKMAHIFYRTLALVNLRKYQRDVKAPIFFN